ncbi:BEL1-like homeodomain protein 2-like protein [Drosera capensis]
MGVVAYTTTTISSSHNINHHRKPTSSASTKPPPPLLAVLLIRISMSEDYSSSRRRHHQQQQLPHHQQQLPDQQQQQQQQQQGFFSFHNGFDQSGTSHQIRSDKQGFDESAGTIGLDQPEVHNPYEEAGMLSEMFNFGHGAARSATELLEHQMSSTRIPPLGSNWYVANRQASDDGFADNRDQIPTIKSAAAMQVFLSNPSTSARSSSPPPQPQRPPPPSGSTLHMLLPSPPPGFGPVLTQQAQLGGFVEGQGLSLSLSSSLHQHLEAAKAESELDLRTIGSRDDADGSGMIFFNRSGIASSSNSGHQQQYPFRSPLHGNRNFYHGYHHNPAGEMGYQHPAHVGYGSTSVGMVNMLMNSRYAKAAQELLEEFCSVGRGQPSSRKSKSTIFCKNPTSNPGDDAATCGNEAAASTSNSKEPPAALSAGDRMEHQRRKVKLIAMLDEVDKRYNRYSEQMQMVVNSFDLVMGFGAAVPYTSLAQKAMSRHFRCLKDAIQAQLKHSCERLGEKDVSGIAGLTKGETPRLKLLEQSLRQQRAFHQMGMMEQEAWRPQRGLPERSVNILRAWLFEHFLHPYPSDADKHQLARQTGLSRSQVSNWFINARVRLWKPMVEEMYQHESKDEEDEQDHEDQRRHDHDQTLRRHHSMTNITTVTTTTATATSSSPFSQAPMSLPGGPPQPESGSSASASATASTISPAVAATASAPNTTPENDLSFVAINRQWNQSPIIRQHQQQQHRSSPPFSTNYGILGPGPSGAPVGPLHGFPTELMHHQGHHQLQHRSMFGSVAAAMGLDRSDHRIGTAGGTVPSSNAGNDSGVAGPAGLIRTTSSAGDVSLTLGLRHAANAPEKSNFFIRDLGS